MSLSATQHQINSTIGIHTFPRKITAMFTMETIPKIGGIFLAFVVIFASAQLEAIVEPGIPLEQEVVIDSGSPTNWGEWFAFENCPPNTFVFGMQQKNHGEQGAFGEDTALNGVTFFCGPFEASVENLTVVKAFEDGNGTEPIVHTAITSQFHDWGSWGKTSNCSKYEIATGFQMRFEPSGGWFVDDTAANNLRLYCNGRKFEYLEGDGTSWGGWAQGQWCPAKMAMCGISTQVYYSSGTDDETAMDGLRAKCCDIPNPAAICIPTDQWDLVIECDNLEAISPTTCTYSKKVGTSNYTSTSENHWDILNTYTELGFGIGGAAGPLLLNFHSNLNISTSTGYDWKTSSTEMWNEEITTTVTFEVPARVRSELFQIFGHCGIYGARATRFKKVDTEADGTGFLKQVVSYFDA
ncbi:uncharacterized protein LOC110857547 [Folsomia candida]|uniref:Vitelline membrane outer layer protein 1 n=1 Tax=Folsomia candida TaxID=158441 RepID=A0A226DJ46_FOLCA|nr:uncharacterized protein LOC110857547 [Folsomia candida]OXA44707.1 Vitelline membrane outer layer protein 1 [Folsomia candida]